MKIKKLWFEIVFVIVNLLIVIFFYKKILLTTILLLIVAIMGLIKWKSLRTLYIFVLIGIIGTLFEILCIYFEIWKYSYTNLLNIPLWLIILWGNAGIVIYQFGRKFKEKKLKL